jgi:hypothetical protein
MRFGALSLTLPFGLLLAACSSTSVNPNEGSTGGTSNATCGPASGGAAGGSGMCAYGKAECDSSAGPCETDVECILCPWGGPSCDNAFTKCARDNACACGFQCEIQCVRNKLGGLELDAGVLDDCAAGCGSSVVSKAAMLFVAQNSSGCCSLH